MSYYRTVIEVEILSDYAPQFRSLAQIHKEIYDGDSSGKWEVKSQEEVSAEKMAELLRSQGSDPAFLIDELREDTEYIDKDQCVFLSLHLTQCDDSGYCNYCGEQD